MRQVSTFSARLLAIRQERQLTLEELSKLVGYPPQTLNRWERGIRSPRVDAAAAVSAALAISPLWLLGYDAPQRADEPSLCLTPAEATMLEQFRAIPPQMQDAISTMIRYGYEQFSQQSTRSEAQQ